MRECERQMRESGSTERQESMEGTKIRGIRGNKEREEVRE